ncbi:MAG: transcriptional repressor LexA [Alphaproteobacteria bacterium]|jgi:repressor LexA|nr:transcriptional repressor LexA [Rhodospirillaceae bacterium]MBT7611584.1 transcriptional repressor LexA [Rhodospirillaceae bacterium]MBT7646093.1 transcriptional repressor LexA [Rhodospirillaceae bacterium]MDG2480272.1 transcriptional repressor LexA [Alphaproteobacteria bacterium]
MLTRKQQELLLYINSRLAEDGVSPSFDEMKDAVGLKSKSGIHRLITALEERGFLHRLPHRARALEVLKLPPGVEGVVATLSVIEGARAANAEPLHPNEVNDNTVNLVLHGKIAAGTPIEALSDPTQSVNVPAAMVGAKDCYALEIEGDSMIEAGILDGDTVVVERSEYAENGTIVVALVDNQEATLKRLRRKGDSVALEPANAAYETRIFGPDRVKVQGRLVGLLRNY